MITTRTRILSILATVAMLVSMLACFVIPASADESVTAPYAALLEDVPGATNLAAVISTATDETTLSDALAQDVAAGNITWPTWEYGNVDYPRYAYKAVYDAAGYTAKEYSITTPADWRAMVAASSAATPETFTGYTFHVTQNIDFEDVDMYPLSPGNGIYNDYNGSFEGTIKGHNHAFKRISVIDSVGTGTNRILGMICKLGDGALIENFGVDSGKIVMENVGTSRNVASTFGQAMPSSTLSATPQLINVWSGVDIKTSGGSSGSYACGILNYSADTFGGPIVNGAYFDGSLDADNEYGILYNLRTGRVYNALSNPATATYAFSLQSSSIAVASNIYSVNHATHTDTAGGANVINDSTNNNAATVGEAAWKINSTQPRKAYTLELNSKNGAVKYNEVTTDEKMAPAYFTWTTNSLGETVIRPTSDDTNRIVKVNVAGLEDPLYVNLNTTELTKAYLAELTENANIIGYKLDEGDEVVFTDTNYVELTGDEQTITFTMTEAGALAAAREKYTNLLAYSQYLTEGAVNAINTFLNDEELTAGNLTEKEGTLIGQLETYYTYEDVDTDGKNIPGYSLVEELGEYNVHTAEGVAGKQVWAISAPEDWTAMVDASDIALGDDVETFENHIFHLTGNIDFDDPDAEGTVGIEMAPLSLGNGTNNNATGAFKGTIEGHGYAFENINVYDEIKAATNRVSGLIGKLGDGAVINDFGVASGTIELTGENTSQTSVATFGEGVPTSAANAPQLNRVWSNANIILSATSTNATNYASGLIANGGDNSGGVAINGAYFSGTLTNDIDSSMTVGIYRNFKTGTVYNALSNPAVAAYALQRSSTATGTHENVFSVNYDPYSGFDSATDTKNGNAASALAGAWAINNAQTTEDEIADVYFTLDGENIRFGNADNRIVKVTVNTDEKEIYVNNGETLNKAYFADLYDGVDVNAITINGDAANESVTAEDGLNVEITVDYAALLASARDKYDGLDGKYLVADAAEKLDTFLTSTDDPQTVLATEGALIDALTGGVFTDYANQGEKQVPGYKDVELYGAYNTAKVWTINEPADWLKMVDDSVANDFYGYVFHVTDNIDFSTVTEPMLPLNYGDDALKDKADYPFNGTIEGYGNAFKNINVQVTISNAGLQCATGMIGKLGPYAVINNFGVDNGTIHAIGDADKQPARVYATTFGEPLNLEAEGAVNWPDDLTTQHAELNNVWSGADLIAEGAADDANYASGIVAQAQNSYMVINGAYFYGTLQGDTLAGITENQTRINVYNALNDNAGTAAMFVTTATNGKLNNVYSTRGNKVETTLNVKPANTNQDSETGEVPSCTAEEAAWMLNNANVAAAAADGIAKVYFTKVGDAIRFGEEANRIVKYTYTINNEAKDPVYANAGAAVDVATVLNLVEGAAFTVANETETLTENADGTYNIEGDVTVTVTLDESEEQIQALTEKLAEYDLENLNLDYFKTADELEAGKIGLKAFVEMAQTAIETQTGLAEAVAQIDNVVAEIKGADDYENLPAFKDHALYEEYQPANENWLIVDQADWTEMDRVALGSTDSGYIGEENDIGGREYFDGVTFHLKDDVIFDYTKDILPLGAYGAAATTARRFSGIIDGHGYGFENIFIKATSDILQGLTTGYDNRGSLGLIAYLGGCEIRNFGINSGWIEAGTGNYRQPASTFGCVPMSGTTAEDPLVLNNVWNHGWVISSANTGISGLFGTQGRNNTYDIFAEVDGAVLDGVLAQYNIRQSPLIAGVFGGFATAPSENSSLTFSNVIVSADMGFYSEVTKGETPDKNEITFGTTCANGTEVEAKHITLFVLNSADSYNAENFKNVIGITGTNKVQSGAVTRNTTYDANPLDSAVIDSAASLLSADYADASAAAYAINTSGTNGNVYFKLVDGNVRPTGTATNKIVMVTVNGVGEEPATIYINTDEVYTKADLAELLGKKEADITTVASDDSNATVGEGYTLEVSADAEITVTTCNHPEASYDYEYIEGTGKHKIICGECQGVINESKTCSGDVGVVIVAETGEAYKDRTCTLCDGYYKKNCDNAILTPNTEDCTQNSVWVVDCCDEHRALEPVEKPGTANGTHTFPDGWTNDVNIANKQYKKCENCATKLYQYAGALNGGEISVKALKDGEYVIELPDNLAEATLTFTMTGDYTYEVEGATLVEGDVYKVEGVTQVTVKVTAKLTANGGKLAFAMTGAKATAEEGSTETIAITDADAYIQINHSKVEGDATGDGNVNLQDALFALYVKVEKPGYDATSINVANVDKNGDNVVDIDEVYAIVKSWLSSIVATV